MMIPIFMAFMGVVCRPRVAERAAKYCSRKAAGLQVFGLLKYTWDWCDVARDCCPGALEVLLEQIGRDDRTFTTVEAVLNVLHCHFPR